MADFTPMSPCGLCGTNTRCDLLEHAPGGVIVRGPLCPVCAQEIEIEIDAETHEDGCTCDYHRAQLAELEREARAREASMRGGLSRMGLEALGGDFLADLEVG